MQLLQKNKTSRKLISKGYKETTMKKMQQDWMDTVQFLSSGNCTRMYRSVKAFNFDISQNVDWHL